MALIKCPECGREISDKATACPGCGFPIAATPETGLEPEPTQTIEPEPIKEEDTPGTVLATPSGPIEQPPAKRNRTGDIIALVVIAGIFVVLIASWISSSIKPARSSASYSSYSRTTATPAPTLAGTLGEQNALRKAKDYLSVLPFSNSGLIKQLEYEGFSTSEATYGAEHCGADWNEQAARKAKSYMDIMAFSKDGLIEQLEYDGFTSSQAVYGAKAVGY